MSRFFSSAVTINKQDQKIEELLAKWVDEKTTNDEKNHLNCSVASFIEENLGCVNSVFGRDGTTLLMYAAKAGNSKVLDLLLRQNADVTIRDKNKKTALIYSCEQGIADCTALLLRRAGARLSPDDKKNIASNKNWYSAYQNGVKKAADDLILLKFKGYITPLDQKELGFLKDFTEACIEIFLNPKDMIYYSPDQEENAKMTRAELLRRLDRMNLYLVDSPISKDKIDIIMKKQSLERIFFSSQVDLSDEKVIGSKLSALYNNAVPDGWLNHCVSVAEHHWSWEKLPLFFAACLMLHRLSIVKWFVGKKPEIVNILFKNTSSLMFAVLGGNFPVAQYLLSSSAQVNEKNAAGETALMLAARGNNAKILDCLVQHGAQVNVKNTADETALILACKSGMGRESIALLLCRGAEPPDLKQHSDSHFNACYTLGLEAAIDGTIKKIANLQNLTPEETQLLIREKNKVEARLDEKENAPHLNSIATQYGQAIMSNTLSEESLKLIEEIPKLRDAILAFFEKTYLNLKNVPREVLTFRVYRMEEALEMSAGDEKAIGIAADDASMAMQNLSLIAFLRLNFYPTAEKLKVVINAVKEKYSINDTDEIELCTINKGL